MLRRSDIIEEKQGRGRPKKSIAEKVVTHFNFGMRVEDYQNLNKIRQETGKTKHDAIREALEFYAKTFEK